MAGRTQVLRDLDRSGRMAKFALDCLGSDDKRRLVLGVCVQRITTTKDDVEGVTNMGRGYSGMRVVGRDAG